MKATPAPSVRPLPWSDRAGLIRYFETRGFRVGQAHCKCGHRGPSIIARAHRITAEPCPTCGKKTLRFLKHRAH